MAFLTNVAIVMISIAASASQSWRINLKTWIIFVIISTLSTGALLNLVYPIGGIGSSEWWQDVLTLYAATLALLVATKVSKIEYDEARSRGTATPRWRVRTK